LVSFHSQMRPLTPLALASSAASDDRENRVLPQGWELPALGHMAVRLAYFQGLCVTAFKAFTCPWP
jgi:hypothetical protein